MKSLNLLPLAWRPASAALLGVGFAISATIAAAQQSDKPLNFLIIWGDDIGYWNISAYNQGMMGYETPNIDRIANEGMAA